MVKTVFFRKRYRKILVGLGFFGLSSAGLLLYRYRWYSSQKQSTMRIQVVQKNLADASQYENAAHPIEAILPLESRPEAMMPSQQPRSEEQTMAQKINTDAAQSTAHPPTREPLSLLVKAQGISLYALWKRNEPLVSPSTEVIDQIGSRIIKDVSTWQIMRLTWRGNEAGTEIEVQNIFQKLQNRLDTLQLSSLPIYHIFHIEHLYMPQRLFFSQKARIEYEKEMIDQKKAFSEICQSACALGPDDVINDWSPTSFRHYDPESQQHGWLVISPRQALLVNVSEKQPLILANLLQPADIDDHGINSQYYRIFQSVVIQWVSNQDTRESVNQIKELVESGQNAVDGQVWLSLILAAIGIIIAVWLPDLSQTNRIVTSVTILSLAALCFWGYARWGKNFWLHIGIFFVLAVLPCIFLWTKVIMCFDAIKEFILHFK